MINMSNICFTDKAIRDKISIDGQMLLPVQATAKNRTTIRFGTGTLIADILVARYCGEKISYFLDFSICKPAK